MRIRNARIEDAKEIVSFNKQTIRRVNAKDYPKEVIEKWSRALNVVHFRKRFKEGNRKVFVAVEGKQLVGFVAVNLEKLSIRALYVHPDFIGRGIGKKLLKKGEDFLRRQGVKKSVIHCSLTAIPFYESQGYKKVRWGHSKIGEAKVKDLIMSKKL